MVVALAGCYHGTARTVSLGDLGQDPGWVLVGNLPLVRQTAHHDCGAAALAMMLRHWSVPAPAEEILRAIPMEPGRGITIGALRDFARNKGLTAFVVKGELADLVNEVGQNRPVLVGLLQRHGKKALSHFAVVAGINQTRRRVLLLDPARGLREDSFEGFSAEWTPAGSPALVIVPP